MERWKFTREFKLEAVRLIKNRGVSYAEASRVCPFRGRVEDGRGNLRPMANAPFPIPARRTGRAGLRHPALRLVSSHGTRRCSERQAFEAQESVFSIDDVTGEAFGPAPCHFVPSGEEVAHALIDVLVHTTECRSTRPVAEVV
jgi:hypothetical protein